MPDVWITNGHRFHALFSNFSNWDSRVFTNPILKSGSFYFIEIDVTQTYFSVKVNGGIVVSQSKERHIDKPQQPCFAGDPWNTPADIIIYKVLVTNQANLAERVAYLV